MNDDYSFYNSNRHRNSRRQFMKGTGSLVALGSLPAYVRAGPEGLHGHLGGIMDRQGIVVFRQDDAHSVAFAGTLEKAGLEAIALTDDPVRQWRDGLGDKVAASAGPVMGLTSWPDYLILNGLAAEHRKLVQLEIQHAVEQTGHHNWSASLAIGYLQLPVKAGRDEVHELAKEFLGEETVPVGTPSLFSWLIA